MLSSAVSHRTPPVYRCCTESAISIRQAEVPKSFMDEIQNDVVQCSQYFHGGHRAVPVFRRLMIMLDSPSFCITNHLERSVLAKNNGLPIATYICHGSRVLIEIPAGTGDQLINWLTSGNVKSSGISEARTQAGALAENRLVYSRTASTHALIVNEYGMVEETQAFGTGVAEFFKNAILGCKTHHFGLDLAFGDHTEEAEADERGHLYMRYQAPTVSERGVLLIGLEKASPNSAKHSIWGTSDTVSASGGSKFDVLEIKRLRDPEAAQIVIPRRLNGMRLSLTPDSMQDLLRPRKISTLRL